MRKRDPVTPTTQFWFSTRGDYYNYLGYLGYLLHRLSYQSSGGRWSFLDSVTEPPPGVAAVRLWLQVEVHLVREELKRMVVRRC